LILLGFVGLLAGMTIWGYFLLQKFPGRFEAVYQKVFSSDGLIILFSFGLFTGLVVGGYVVWISFITTDVQVYAVLLRLRSLLVWGTLVCAQALFMFGKQATQAIGGGAGKHFWTFCKERCFQDGNTLWALGGLILVGVGIRAYFLPVPIHFDEASTYLRFASESAWKAISFYPAPNNHVFHSLIVYCLTQVFGGGVFTLRFTAFFAGVLVIPAAYMAGTLLYDQRVGILAAALLVPSTYMIQFSTNARGYTMVSLFSLLLVILAAYLISYKNLVAWLWFTLVSVLGFFTIPIMLYPYLAVMLWLALSYYFKEVAPNYSKSFLGLLFASGLAATILTLILYSPIIVFSGWEALAGNSFVAPLPWDRFVMRLPDFLVRVWGTWVRDVPLFLGSLIAMGVIAQFFAHKRQARNKVNFIYPILIASALILFAQRAIPFTRSWLFYQPFLFIFAAAGWVGLLSLLPVSIPENVKRSFLPLVVTAVVLLAFAVKNTDSIYLTTETGTLPEGDKVAATILVNIEPGDVVLSNRPGYMILQYYLGQGGVGNEVLASWSEEQGASRVFAVVNELYNENIGRFINLSDLNTSSRDFTFSPLTEYEYASIYLIEFEP
jgi:hypothetical protein